ETRIETARMADLDRVPQWPLFFDLGPGAAGEPMVMPLGQGRGGLGVARQQREERIELLFVEAEARRELPEQRPELFLQPQHSLGEKIGERRFDVAQLF